MNTLMKLKNAVGKVLLLFILGVNESPSSRERKGRLSPGLDEGES